jgi:hypothetical protein
VEVEDWTPKAKRATVNGKNVVVTQVDGRWGVTVPVNAEGMRIALE